MAEDKAPEDSGAAQAAAQEVIAAFGGIRPMANKLGVAVSTVQGWKERNAIPVGRHDEICAAAVRHGVSLSAATVAASEHPPVVIPEQEVIPPEKPQAAADKPEPDQAAESAETPKPARSESPARSKVPESSSAGRRTESDRETPRPPPGRPSTPPPGASAAAAKPARGGWVLPFVLGAAALAIGAGIAVVSVDLWYGLGKGGDGRSAGAAVAGLEQDLGGLREDLAAQIQALEALEATQTQALEALEAELTARPAGGATGTAPEVTRDLEKLGLEAGDLAARLTRLEQGAGAPGASPEELQSLVTVSRGLEDRLGALETRLTDLERLEQDLAALKARPAGAAAASGNDMALLLAIVQLRDALGGSGPYASRLEDLRSAVAGDDLLTALTAPLAARAETGVPTVAQLAQGFSGVAGGIVAAGAGDESDGMLSGVMRRLGDVVTVRPVGNVEGSGAGAVVARAEYRLAGGDLAGAIAELDGLSGPAAKAAAAWRTDADARLAVDAAFAEFAGKAVARFTSGGG